MIAAFSQRSADIEAAVDTAIDQTVQRCGRHPSPRSLNRIRQHITLATRDRKKAVSLALAVENWQHTARAVLGTDPTQWVRNLASGPATPTGLLRAADVPDALVHTTAARACLAHPTPEYAISTSPRNSGHGYEKHCATTQPRQPPSGCRMPNFDTTSPQRHWLTSWTIPKSPIATATAKDKATVAAELHRLAGVAPGESVTAAQDAIRTVADIQHAADQETTLAPARLALATPIVTGTLDETGNESITSDATERWLDALETLLPAGLAVDRAGRDRRGRLGRGRAPSRDATQTSRR